WPRIIAGRSKTGCDDCSQFATAARGCVGASTTKTTIFPRGPGALASMESTEAQSRATAGKRSADLRPEQGMESMRFLRPIVTTVMIATVALVVRSAHAQSFGVELNNTLMPASGGMGGTSIAEPQDLLSAINGNAGSLSQFEGTQ